jgi:serine/threonine protein kinase/Tfp pilus assembly protein PilF
VNSPVPTAHVARFGVFELDLRARELRKNGSSTGLPEQSIKILALLLETPGEVVLREEVRKKLWPNDTIVEFDHSINAAMTRLRQALGDSPDEPKFIETLARRGYRWKIPVEWVEGTPSPVGALGVAPAEAESFASKLIGKKVSHYRVLEILGGGGMGVVYKAEDIRLGRRVALKFLPEESAKDAAALARFEREARSASALEHPSICPIYEFGEHEGLPFIVMQLLEGETLRERIGAEPPQPGKPLPTDELLDFAIQITRGLEAAHENGIIHRDIKPANIFITKRGEAKILDFGVAKLLHDGVSPEATAVPESQQKALPPDAVRFPPSLTRTGTTVGTASYMSPEQVLGEKLDARTDLFSFGLVLYEMSTGQQAFQGETAQVLREAIQNRTHTAARELNSELPRGLEVIINKALEKDRNLRYQSAGEFRSDLQNLKHEADSERSVAELKEAASSASAKKEKFADIKHGAYVKRRRWPALAGIAATLLSLAALGAYYYLHRAKTLTDKDTIVLSDFANTTGDGVFDDTLKQALAIQLEQSPFLSLVSESRVQQTMRLMGQPADARLTPKIARELCQRAQAAAVLEGAIASLGSEYVLGLKAVNCRTGDSLAQEQGTASRKEQVLKVLDGAAVKVRAKLGESISTVEKYATPIEQATTPSLEALQAYSLGRKTAVGKGDAAGAVPFFQRAILLDPNFAMAYASLGTDYSNLGESNLAAENTRKAYELREQVSEREKYYIESHYHDFVTGDMEKTRQVYELWAQSYPRDSVPSANLSTVYAGLGQLDKSHMARLEAVRLDPENGLNYSALVDSYLNLNRLEHALATAEKAKAKNLDSPSLRVQLYLLAFMRNDAAGMAQQVGWSAGKPGVEDVLLAHEAKTAAYAGQLAKAREIARRAVASAKHADEQETAAGYEIDSAMREALFGNAVQARQRAMAALALSTGRDAQFGAALALALAGDSVRARSLAKDLAKRYPEDTVVKFIFQPTLDAQLTLSRTRSANSSKKGPVEATEILQVATPFELGSAGRASFDPSLLCVYVRGEAYLAGGQGSEAAAEFQKILDHRGIVQNGPIGALAHLQLGRAYALQGDTAKARAAFQDFLALWKDADPDIPILKQAKVEYAKLH